jgi:hypothetical protein
MYRFKICNRIKLVCFIKFIIHEMNYEMIKSEIAMLIRRENDDTDVIMDWMLQPAARALVGEREKTDAT